MTSFWLQNLNNRDYGVLALIFALFQAKKKLTFPTTVEEKKRPKINQNSQENCNKILEKRKISHFHWYLLPFSTFNFCSSLY